MKKITLGIALILSIAAAPNGFSQGNPVFYHGWWQGNLIRPDGENIVFNFLVKDSAGKTILYVRNAAERLLVDNVQVSGDSVHIQMPFFESGFRARITADGHLEGLWVRKTATGEWTQRFAAYPGKEYRFAPTDGNARASAEGRWATTFYDGKGNPTDTAVGEFSQKGNQVTGTFLTPTGDYRFLEGIVTGDSLKVSTFDGSHAYVFAAKIRPDHTLEGKMFALSYPPTRWSSTWNPNAILSEESSEARLINKDSTQLHFRFPDMDSNIVSINDPRFHGKVVVIQIMGSWCPNCMDETAFLSQYYKQNKDRGVEIVGLAYEKSTNFQRSKKALETFRNRFDVQYPYLITGVTVSDPQRAAKTIPEIDAIRSFPSTLILDKKGNVRIIRAGFEGPGTGEHYDLFQKEFNESVNTLLAE